MTDPLGCFQMIISNPKKLHVAGKGYIFMVSVRYFFLRIGKELTVGVSHALQNL